MHEMAWRLLLIRSKIEEAFSFESGYTRIASKAVWHQIGAMRRAWVKALRWTFRALPNTKQRTTSWSVCFGGRSPRDELGQNG
jgi:hypothetical protein